MILQHLKLKKMIYESKMI